MVERLVLVRADLERMNLPEEFWRARVQPTPEQAAQPEIAGVTATETTPAVEAIPAKPFVPARPGVPDAAIDPIKRYLRGLQAMTDRGIGLLLWGPPGVGKTAIAALIAKEARTYGLTVFFVTVFDLRELMRARIDFEGNTSVFERCRDVDVLVLDALRIEDASEHLVNLSTVESLIEHRNSRKKTTIVTSRNSPRQLKDTSASFMETLKGRVFPLMVSGPNLRDKNEEALKNHLLQKK